MSDETISPLRRRMIEDMIVRGMGENQSIISMIDHMQTSRGIDPTKVYVVGFSAGGAFVKFMLV